MTLNLVAEAEHPDVVAVKEKVREVAMKYAKKHNWCDVVSAALIEAGIVDGQKVRVIIRFTVSGSEPQEAKKTYPVSDLAGKTVEEQHAFVADDIAPKVLVVGTEVTLPVTVIDLTQDGDLIGGQPTPGHRRDGLAIPAGYIGFYMSDAGRVAHLVRDPGTLTSVDSAMREAQISTWLRDNRRGLIAACGASPDYYAPGVPVIHSPRTEHRFCSNCERQTRR